MNLQDIAEKTNTSVAVVAAIVKIVSREFKRRNWTDEELEAEINKQLDENERRLLADRERLIAELNSQ